MFWRRLHRTFPVFFSYIVFQVVNFPILFPIYQLSISPNATDREIITYFYAYWISAAISLALGFKIIHEIFLDVLRPYPNLKDMGTLLFKWAALVMLLVAMVVTAASQSGTGDPLAQAVHYRATLRSCDPMRPDFVSSVFFPPYGGFPSAAQLRRHSGIWRFRVRRADCRGTFFGRSNSPQQ